MGQADLREGQTSEGRLLSHRTTWGPLLSQRQGPDVDIFACPLSKAMPVHRAPAPLTPWPEPPAECSLRGCSARSMEARGRGGSYSPRQDLPISLFEPLVKYLLTLQLHSHMAPGLI